MNDDVRTQAQALDRICAAGARTKRMLAAAGVALAATAFVPRAAEASAVAIFSLQQTGTNTPGFFAGATLLVTEKAYREGFSFSVRDAEVPLTAATWEALGLLRLDVFARYRGPRDPISGEWDSELLADMSRFNPNVAACPTCNWGVEFSLSALPMGIPTGNLLVLDRVSDRQLGILFDGPNSSGFHNYNPSDGPAACRQSTLFSGEACTFTGDFRFVALVPEPASLAVLGVGLAALAGAGMRRARRARAAAPCSRG